MRRQPVSSTHVKYRPLADIGAFAIKGYTRIDPEVSKKWTDMDNGNCHDQAWVQLIREIIASWRLLLGAVVLLLACAPVAVAVVLLFLAPR